MIGLIHSHNILFTFFHTVFILLLLLLFNNIKYAKSVPSHEIQIISDGEDTGVDGEPVDLLVTSRRGDKQNDQRLFGTFSSAGHNYETAGDIVQVV